MTRAGPRFELGDGLGRILSKSRLIAFRQCPKRLWLEVHRPHLRDASVGAQARLSTGNEVGELARQVFDPRASGVLINPHERGFKAAVDRSRELLGTPQPIFEAGFQSDGIRAFVDLMLPTKARGRLAWRLVEVKSSSSVKDYHLEDVAIQVFSARAAGVPLHGAAIAHIDSKWVYPGGGDYGGLLTEVDVTEQALERQSAVSGWLAGARTVAARRKEPQVKMGRQCNAPFECGFFAYCQGLVPAPRHPIDQLPGSLKKALKSLIEEKGLTELEDLPEDLLNERQLRVRTSALSRKVFFDRKGAKERLKCHGFPAYFMDFETIQFAVPIWEGTRPYQQVPFQFSVHRLSRSGKLDHRSFLDLSGRDPSRAFAEALVGVVGERGPVFSYNASFEAGRIRDLADRFPRLAKALHALERRLVDLLPIAKDHYYHPSQMGSWSIKAVLPAMFPSDNAMDYAALEGVKDGAMAMEAYAEAIGAGTTEARKAELHRQLTAYCALDTLSLVKMWGVFSGSKPRGA